MRQVLREHGVSLFAITTPLLVLLFGWNSWEVDPRTEPLETRLERLEKSNLPWDKVLHSQLLRSGNPNELVDGLPLFVREAVAKSDEPLLEHMVARGADVNSSDWGCTALLVAVEGSDTRIVERLLNAGADPNANVPADALKSAKHGHGCLHDVEKSLLAIAIQKDNPHTLRALLNAKARPKTNAEATHLLGRINDWQSFDRYTDLIAVLKTHGGIVPEHLPTGDTPVGDAVRNAVPAYSNSERISALRAVIGGGASVNSRSRDGELPLGIALRACTPVRNLGEQVGRPDAYRDEMYLNSWREAEVKTRPSNARVAAVVEVLLQNGADPNLPLREDGDASLLSFAIQNCTTDIPRLLIRYKARINKAALQAGRYDFQEWLQEQASLASSTGEK